jgi:hypothetical protein
LDIASDKPGIYTISLPKEAPDPIASVVCLEVKPRVAAP